MIIDVNIFCLHRTFLQTRKKKGDWRESCRRP
jgi:hypothetical protein